MGAIDRATALVEEGRSHRNAGRLDEGRTAFTAAVAHLHGALDRDPAGDEVLRVEIARVYWQLFLLETYKEDGHPWLDQLRDVLLPLRRGGGFDSEDAGNLWDSATRVLGTCLVEFGPSSAA